MSFVRVVGSAAAICVMWSCGQQGQQSPAGPTPPPQVLAQQKVEPPTMIEALNATYTGFANGQLMLRDGKWEREKAYATMLDGFLIAGDLDRDGSPESIVIVNEGVRGGASADYLAVLARKGGQIVNLSTVKLGPALQIRSAAVENANVNLNVIRQGKDDQPGFPTEKVTLTYAMPSGSLAKANELVTGTATLADMAGNEWLLAKWNAAEAVAPETAAYFHVEGATLVGKGPCNSFNTPYAGEAAGYKIKVGPLVSTKMACPAPKQPAEDRFFKTLESVTRVSFSGGRLLMHYAGEKGAANTMVFTSRPVTKAPDAAAPAPGAPAPPAGAASGS